MAIKISPNDPCPCDSGLSYKNCCQILHKGGKAPSPEALMRSRYSAYALDLPDYIIKTTHPDGPQYNPDLASWKRDIQQFSRITRFERLQILGAQGDMVTFHASLVTSLRDDSYTEVSVFRQHNGAWKYYSGTLLEH